MACAGTAAAAVVALSGGSALAASGGATPPSTGGVGYSAPPKIEAVKCVASCMSGGRVQTGGKLKLRGAKLAGVTKIVFRGAPGGRDDVPVKVSSASDKALRVPVPFAAQSGPLEAYAGKMHASTPRAVTIMPPAAPKPNTSLTPAPGPAAPGAPTLETATSRSLLAIDQRGGVTFSYRVSGVPAAALQVTLIRIDDGSVVKTWTPAPPADGATGTLSWDGLSGRSAASSARYAFRLVARAADGAAASSAADGDAERDAFDLRPAVFPVRGRHDFGSAAGRFGAARSGHIHQGQDVMAACGLPLVAARGGVVKAKQYQANAGYYLVIDGQGTDVDYGYMHLRAPSAYNVGDRVYTGDQIGLVGDTGDATACHLHFEEWSGPGWYSGGKPFDPLADLKAWDAYS
ncbi:MAG: hypothetical protein QOC95_1523 [Thermoleophilaceae bacterium]|nr:hypothetical protein [Thermoleophilaceae bacterium]